MNQHPAVLTHHDCERLPDRAWLAQLTTEIRARDAEEGLLLPLSAEELAGKMSVPPGKVLTGIAWLTDIALRTLPPPVDGPVPTAAAESVPALAADEESAPAPLLRARQHAREGDLAAALAAYASLLPQGPGLASGAEDLEALGRVQPRNAEILQILGDVQYALGRAEDACVSYQRALALLAHETP